MSTPSYITLRIHPETHRKLRLIAALANERIIGSLERMATQELARLEAERAKEQKEPHV
ncbi:MAG TPA: hypothetical protein VH599_00840 [Ktedonobacterales bacterium]|jgi:hypothetical protein